VKSSYPASHAYRLYADGEVVSYLQWRHGGGWFLWACERGWTQVAEEAEPAAALDAAAKVLLGPPVPTRPTRQVGHYEIHVCGLAPDVVPIAFPDTITVRTGDVSVLAGDFDDDGLCRLTRRVTLLGGQLLALFVEAGA
jgi:hypothetical protein